MELHLLAVRLATIAALVPLLASAPWAVAPQRPPDPLLEVPQPRGFIPDDPYESGTELGDLFRPKGRVRRVTWFRAMPEDPHDAGEASRSKRIVQVFDDEGRCVEVERWCCGAREYWRTARSPIGTPRDFEQTWGHPMFRQPWREDVVCDRTGSRIGLVHIPFSVLAVRESECEPADAADSMPRIAAKWSYDEAGRCVREARFDEDRWPVSIRRWHYDEQGRLLRIVDLRPGEPQVTEDFEYDGEGRLTACTARGPRKSDEQRTEFTYDASGRLSRIAERLDEAVTRSVVFGWGEDGRLIRRETRPLLGSREVERFDGADRLLVREVYDSRDEVAETLRWAYVDDSRGNWIRRTCSGSSDPGDRVVWREIEYAD